MSNMINGDVPLIDRNSMDNSNNIPLSRMNVDENDVNVELTDDKDTTRFDYKAQKINWNQVLLASCLLSSPLIMGICINSLGHQKIIDNQVSSNSFKYVIGYLQNLHSIGGLFPLGGLIAAPISSAICDKFGKKIPTILFYIVSLVAFVFKFASFYGIYELIFVGRLLDGIASGGLMVTAVSWLFDLLPKKLHMFYKPLIQIFINTGIVIVALFALQVISGYHWNLTYISQLVMSCVSLGVSCFLPESHVYLYSKDRNRAKLEKSLKYLRKDGYDVLEVDEIIQSIEQRMSIRQMSLLEFIREKRFRPPLTSAILLNVFQQASGINVVVAFTTSLISGLSNNPTSLTQSYYYVMYILLVGLCGSLAAAPFVGKFPRKIMLMIGFSGMSLCFLCASLVDTFSGNKPTLIAMYGIFFLVFQFGPGPLVWFICVEMFPPDAVSSAQGISTVANWFSNSCVFFLFPVVEKAIGNKVLYIFTIINITALLYTSFGVVETNNRKYNDVIDEYGRKYGCCA